MASQNPFPAQADIYGFQTIARTCSEVDQVWLYTGNFIKRLTLVNVPTIGFPLSFMLTYNSQDTVDGPLGNGFRHNYMINLAFTGDPPTHVNYTASTGIQYGFIYDSDTDTWGPDGASYFFKGTLTQVDSNWNVTMPDGSYCQFNSDGVLTSMVDNHGNVSPMTYNESGQLTSVAEPTGRSIELAYTDGLLTGVTDPRGNEVTLSFTDGNLTQVTFPSGCYSTYGWTYLSTYGQWMLTSRTDTNGTYTYSYENTSGTPTSGRLIGVSDASSPANTISYAYHQPTDETPVIEYLADTTTPTPFTATVLTDTFGHLWQYDFDSSGNIWRVFQASLVSPASQQLSHWRHYYWDNNQQLLYASGGYPLTFEFDNGPAAGPRDSINNVFHRYAYDNNYGFNGNTDVDNTTGNSQGLLLYEADETGLVTAYTYDENQNVLSVYPGQAHLGVQGNWVGQYGSEGYVLCNFLGNGTGQDLIVAPSYINTGNITLTPAANVTIAQQNLFEGASYNYPSLADCRCLMSPTGPDRNIGFWSANGTFTVALPFSGETAQSFNLSVYTNSVDQGYGGNTDSTSALMYAEQFGRDVTLTVTDSTDVEQVFRVTNTAPGFWVTFPVTMEPGGNLTLALSASGYNLLSGTPDVRISALAFDPYDSRRTVMTYTAQNDVASIVDPLGNQTSMTYGAVGTLATLTNARGATTQFYYQDAAQNLTQIVDALGNIERRQYDENSNVVQVVDARGGIWGTTFDEQNRVLTRTDPLQSVTSWSYEGPNLVTITDANNNETQFTYTPCGRLWTVTDALSGVTTLDFDSAGNVISVEDPNENVTGFSLDALMRVTTLTRPDSNTVTFSYDALDRLRAVTPPNGNVPSDSLASVITTNGGNLLSNPGAEVLNPFPATPPQAQNWTITSGQRDTTEHYAGLASFKQTNVSGGTLQQTSLAVPPGIRTLVSYQAMSNATSGNLTLTTSLLPPPVNGDTSTSYTVTSPSWNLTVHDAWQAVPPVRLDIPGDGQYDRFPVSNFTQTCTAGQSGSDAWIDNISMCSLSQAMAYDGAGRLTQTQGPDGSVVTRVRDRFGRTVVIQDARGQSTTLTYDSLDRILTVTTPLGETMAWTYDSVGNVLTFEDPNTNVTSYTTDLLNRLTAITYPDTTQEAFAYDAVSNLIQYTDNNGHFRALSYDAANRLRLVTYQVDSTTVSLTYDRVGNTLFRTDRNGDVTSQQFDALNRLVYVERNPGGVFSTSQSWMQANAYDADSNRTEFSNLLPATYPQYDIAQYDLAEEPGPLPQWEPPTSGSEYNSLNQLLAFRDRLDNETQLAYDSVESRLSTITCSNGVSTGLVYDILGRVVSMSTVLESSALLALAYSYDLNSNRTGCATLTDGFDYGLDADNRLVQEDLNRFVQRSGDRFNTGSGTQIDTTSGAVTMLAFADTLEGSSLNLDRWRLSYAEPSSTFLGFEIRQDSTGLHFAYQRGYNDQTEFFNSNVPVSPPYPAYGAGSTIWGGCEHRTQVTVPFDIQVQFADYQFQDNEFGGISVLTFIIADQPMETSVPSPVNALQLQLNGAYEYRATVTLGGTTTYTGNFTTTNTAGGLRIACSSGGTVTFQTLVDGTWTPLDTGSLTFDVSGPLYVMLVGYGGLNYGGTFTDFAANTNPAAYPTSAVFTSSLYDAGPDLAGGNPSWESLTWEATTPTGTSVEFQVYVGDSADPTEAVYVGPDGTTGTYFTTSGTSLYSGTSGRYAGYQAYLSGNGTTTPTLTRVDMLYNTSSTNGSTAYAYGYDAASNMTSRVVEALGADTVTETRTVNNLNQVTQNVVVDGNVTTTWTYTHDNNGNTLSKSDGTNTTYYQWNDENRLVLVTLPGGATVAYTWDMLGRMLTRTDSDGTTRFVWDRMDLVQETDPADNVTRYYIPDGILLSFERNGSVYQTHWDAIGSIRCITNASGTIVAQFDTDGWGNLLSSSFDDVPSGGFFYRFLGALGVRADLGTGLLYMRQRWYDPSLQCFVSRDRLDTRNRYSYDRCNPVRHVDPLGLDPAFGGDAATDTDDQTCINDALASVKKKGGALGLTISDMISQNTITFDVESPEDMAKIAQANDPLHRPVDVFDAPLGLTNPTPTGRQQFSGTLYLNSRLFQKNECGDVTWTVAHELVHMYIWNMTFVNWIVRHNRRNNDTLRQEAIANDFGFNIVKRSGMISGLSVHSAEAQDWLGLTTWTQKEDYMRTHGYSWCPLTDPLDINLGRLPSYQLPSQ